VNPWDKVNKRAEISPLVPPVRAQPFFAPLRDSLDELAKPEAHADGRTLSLALAQVSSI
jgi:hypothetical protein